MTKTENPDKVVDAKVIKLPKPNHPSEAKETGVGGKVRVRVEIDEEGTVTAAEVMGGPDWVCPTIIRFDVVALHNAAKSAALKAKFLPATLKDKPVKSALMLTYDFPKKPMSGLTVGGARLVDKDHPASGDLPNAELKKDNEPPGLVSGGVLNGKARKLAKPEYPAAARAVHAAGSVNIQVLIETDGSVFSAEPVSGHPLLQYASRRAACDSRFTPTLLSGQPVRVSGIITYNFVP